MSIATTTRLAEGDKVLVTRYYTKEALAVPEIATVTNPEPDLDGDLRVTNPSGDRVYASAWTRIPKPGERIKAVKVPGLNEFDGRIGTVANPAGQPWAERSLQAGFVENDRPKLFLHFEEYVGGPLYVTEWTEVADEPAPVPVDNEFVIAALGGVGSLSDSARETLSRCTTGEQVAVEYARVADAYQRFESQVARLREEVMALRSDLTIVGKALAEQADERDWCEEYESDVEETVGSMSSYGARIFSEAANREKEYEVRTRVPISGYAERTVTVRARNEEEAQEKGFAQLQEEMDEDDIDNYSLEWSWESSETEVE